MDRVGELGAGRLRLHARGVARQGQHHGREHRGDGHESIAAEAQDPGGTLGRKAQENEPRAGLGQQDESPDGRCEEEVLHRRPRPADPRRDPAEAPDAKRADAREQAEVLEPVAGERNDVRRRR